ncbi:MAG: hypothetical protein H0V70_25285 [Ktedonobacteraceae bacterium]|nr:hypothetical protein [Ktedonobacteraceae bacterium]
MAITASAPTCGCSVLGPGCEGGRYFFDGMKDKYEAAARYVPSIQTSPDAREEYEFWMGLFWLEHDGYLVHLGALPEDEWRTRHDVRHMIVPSEVRASPSYKQGLVCYRYDCHAVVHFQDGDGVECGYICDCGHAQFRPCNHCVGTGCTFCQGSGWLYTAYDLSTGMLVPLQD